MSGCIAYLSLQHQLFGEQHGLVTEGFGHLNAPRQIPGTAWTFNTWPKTRQLHELKDRTAGNQEALCILKEQATRLDVLQIVQELTYLASE